MGAWGAGLYSSDFALDLRACISAVARLPFDSDALLETICQVEPKAATEAADPDHTVFWLVVADQFARRGIACAAARDRAVAIVDSGADLAAMAALSMDPRSLGKRGQVLAELRARIVAPVTPVARRVLKAPQKLLLGVGEVLTYPVCRLPSGFEPINPWAVGREWEWVKSWKQDGWGALVVAERGLAFDYLAWYRPFVVAQALASEPTLATLRLPRPWKLASAGTLAARHQASLQLETVGRIDVDPVMLDHLAARRGGPVAAVVSDISIANALGCGACEEGDELADVTERGVEARLRALSDIEAESGASLGPADRRNLSGRWRGEFAYDAGERPAMPFTADLKELAGLLRGEIDESGAADDRRARPTAAIVEGRRVEQAIRFCKRYQSDAKRYVPILYDGEVDETGARVAGRWTLRTGQSGRFTMTRV